MADSVGRRRSPGFKTGPYIGEISALAFLASSSPSPLLLAGTGSQLQIYDVLSGDRVAEFYVFDGVRVHGIVPEQTDSFDGAGVLVAVYGESRVKIFRLSGWAVSGFELALVCQLPRFDHWVLAACFLEKDRLLAAGLSDNSVALWTLDSCTIISRVKSSEKCLLYSMSIWGYSIDNLMVASGTILNEIIVWKLVCQGESCEIADKRYICIHLGRLQGHEGSIFRLSWSADGTQLISASDDRSARIWKYCDQGVNSGCIIASNGQEFTAKRVLYGHSARIWDCAISDPLIITAGEDCTFRVWGLDGGQIMMSREHIGRGIWRCLYHPSLSLIITAGFDSAIKVHHLQSAWVHNPMESDKILCDGSPKTEVLNISVSKSLRQLKPMNSKSEYLRCLHLTREDMLYVATNQGYLHHVHFSNSYAVRWIELFHTKEKTPIVCMDVITVGTNISVHMNDVVAIGDGSGVVSIVRLSVRNSEPQLDFHFCWRAEKERQLLGLYWYKSKKCSHIFTADPRGTLKLWYIWDALESNQQDLNNTYEVPLLAVFESCFGARIMCLDASARAEILVAGDKKGNVIVFPFLESLQAQDCTEAEVVPLCDRFKGAHGICSVTSIYIGGSDPDHVAIHTTGGDGCICFFGYEKVSQKLDFVGMKQVKELGTIQSMSADFSSKDNLVHGSYAIGFTSADFIIWDTIKETKIVQISCGGWRRPYSYYLGPVPEFQNCFAYLKDHTINVHRVWVSSYDKSSIPRVLNMQYHGREVHSLCFIVHESLPESEKISDLWISTGCEDGTVRLTRYSDGGTGRWSSSKLLGEHVGGSAVRHICFIAKLHPFGGQRRPKIHGNNCDGQIANNGNSHRLLISVGSKQVITIWNLRATLFGPVEKFHSGCNPNGEQYFEKPLAGEIDMTFQWLTTHIPPKHSANRSNGKQLVQKLKVDNGDNSALKPMECQTNGNFGSQLVDLSENDWRYLCVTAFCLQHIGSKSAVCFIVVASSDGTLVLRALLLPYRLWFDVALLAMHKASPVLSLRHIISSCESSCDDHMHEDRYIIITGSTDGSIAFWDVSNIIESFMHLVSEVQPQMHVDCQKRPKTGRGSQGGRKWRILATQSSKETDDCLKGMSSTEGASSDEILIEADVCDISNSKEEITCVGDEPRELTSSLDVDMPEVQPLHVLFGAHQSGVNCLHVAEMNNSSSELAKSYCILSGGDDQSLHTVFFELIFTECVAPLENRKLEIIHQDRISSAHSSAVKGIWTDGIWAFSTGLDQRIRCWKLDGVGKLSEHSHIVISVPEPESLDALLVDREAGSYQIAVAGRGMQMVKFSAPSHG